MNCRNVYTGPFMKIFKWIGYIFNVTTNDCKNNVDFIQFFSRHLFAINKHILRNISKIDDEF